MEEGQQVVVRVTNGASAARGFGLSVGNLDPFAGTHNRSRLFPAGAGPSAVAAADFNADGAIDLVVSDGLTNTLSVLVGNGDGSFQAPRQFAIGAYRSPNLVAANVGLPNFHRQVVVADLDGDGRPDVAVASALAGTVTVLAR